LPFLTQAANAAAAAVTAADAAAGKAASSCAKPTKTATADLLAAAKARIGVVLGDDASALLAEDVNVPARLVVVSDAVTTLAVTAADDPAAQVWLVRDDSPDPTAGHEWTRLAQVTSLTSLAAALAAQAPTTTEGGDPA
jgi:hypothetical protein